MRKIIHSLLIAVLAGILLQGTVLAKNSYLNSVNSTCGTSYGCDLCHIDPRGGGPLTQAGAGYRDSGYDPAYFCPGSSCSDNDGDHFGSPGDAVCSGGAATDCDDNNAAINPGAAEICDDMTDNDCDGRVDCADNECTGAPVCQTSSEPEICDDGFDNDGDNKVDCADKKDCNGDPVCSGGSGTAETCDDGFDNDGDARIDCDDRDCRRDPACSGGGGGGGPSEVCDDGVDNDGDGKTDCADKKDCGRDPAC